MVHLVLYAEVLLSVDAYDSTVIRSWCRWLHL